MVRLLASPFVVRLLAFPFVVRLLAFPFVVRLSNHVRRSDFIFSCNFLFKTSHKPAVLLANRFLLSISVRLFMVRLCSPRTEKKSKRRMDGKAVLRQQKRLSTHQNARICGKNRWVASLFCCCKKPISPILQNLKRAIQIRPTHIFTQAKSFGVNQRITGKYIPRKPCKAPFNPEFPLGNLMEKKQFLWDFCPA